MEFRYSMMIWIDGDVWTGVTNCKGMFAQMNVQTVGTCGIEFAHVDMDASFMFNEILWLWAIEVDEGYRRTISELRGCFVVVRTRKN